MSLQRSGPLQRKTPMKRGSRKRKATEPKRGTDLRGMARGRPCELRLPSICNGNVETTVLAHLRMGHTGGMGLKPPDVCGIDACSACHDAIDGRVRSDDPEIHRYLLEALLRRLARLSSEGVLTW